MKKILLIVSVTIAVLVSSCSVLNFLSERLNVFMVNFAFDGIGIGIITPPNLFSTRLSDYGIAVNCTVSAKNENASRVVFDGANFYLRINDTSRTSEGVEALVPSFIVEAGSQTSFTVPFRIMLDNPLFSKTVFKKVVFGDRIPYRVSADLLFNLVAANPGGTRGSALFGAKTMSVDLARDAVTTRPDLGTFAGKAFGVALNLLTRR